MKIRCALLLFIIYTSASAQTQKIGHANWMFIFSHMPEVKQVENELKTYEIQLKTQLEAKQVELEQKLKSYQQLASNTPEAIRHDMENEIAYLKQNLLSFHEEAKSYLQKKEADLMVPVFNKVGKAIHEVARENGYTYIINPESMGGSDVLLYSDPQYDISQLVLKKMGITANLSKAE